MLLKDSPNHLEAFEFARNLTLDALPSYAHDLMYIAKLLEMEPESIGVSRPGDRGESDSDNDGIYYIYHYPFAAEDFEDEDLPGDVILEPTILEVNSHLSHSKKQAAKYCGISSARTLERWVKAGLRVFKLGTERVFIESELYDFMAERGIGERWKSEPFYIPGRAL
jgi:hypothetical protein